MAGSRDRQVELARQAATRLAGTAPRRRRPLPGPGPDTELVRAQLQQFLNRPQRGGPVVPPATSPPAQRRVFGAGGDGVGSRDVD